MTDIDVTDHDALERVLAPIEADIARMEAEALEAAREAHRFALRRIADDESEARDDDAPTRTEEDTE